LTAEIEALRLENDALKRRVEKLNKLFFGPSSEKRPAPDAPSGNAAQGHLFLVELMAEAQSTADRKGVCGSISAAPAKTGEKAKKKGGRRPKFPKDAATVTSEYHLPDEHLTCSCGCMLHLVGYETTKQLERMEMTFIHEEKRAKYACRSCEQGIRTTPGADRPFEKGILGTSFLSYLINERFGNHMPYYRIEKKHAKEGVDISRSVLERSARRCAERLEPLYDLLTKQVRQADILFTDDSPVTIANPSDRDSGSKKGRIWIYLDRAGNHVYDFTDSRRNEGPRAWLADFKGFIHADAYPGYDEIFASEQVTEVACMAHTRRKFIDAESSEPVLAAEILSRIRELYLIEAFAKENGFDDEQRRALRQEKALPILEELRIHLELVGAQVLPQGPMGKAVGYAQRQWDALNVYATDGRLSIDNNAAERALRDIAVGRKNWLFFQSESGGRTAAIILSLLKTAEAAGVNTLDYFRDVLVRIDRERDWTKLLPAAWKVHFADEVAEQRRCALAALAGA
jgi:transposase